MSILYDEHRTAPAHRGQGGLVGSPARRPAGSSDPSPRRRPQTLRMRWPLGLPHRAIAGGIARAPRPVQALLRLCHQRGVPVVARGAGTGLSGGALPLAQGILLVMARFNRIRRSTHKGAMPGSSLACATWRSPRQQRLTAYITRRTLPRRSPAPSAATSPKTPAACIASNTA